MPAGGSGAGEARLSRALAGSGVGTMAVPPLDSPLPVGRTVYPTPLQRRASDGRDGSLGNIVYLFSEPLVTTTDAGAVVVSV